MTTRRPRAIVRPASNPAPVPMTHAGNDYIGGFSRVYICPVCGRERTVGWWDEPPKCGHVAR